MCADKQAREKVDLLPNSVMVGDRNLAFGLGHKSDSGINWLRKVVAIHVFAETCLQMNPWKYLYFANN